MRIVKTLRCACGVIWSTSYRRLWWRWLILRQFNNIPCPDCRYRLGVVVNPPKKP